MKTMIKLSGLVVLLSFMVFCQVCFADEGEKALKKEGAEYIPARPAEQLKALEGIKENIIEQKQSFEEKPSEYIIKPLPIRLEEKPPYNLEPFRKENPILYEEKKIDPSELNGTDKPLEPEYERQRITPLEILPIPKEPALMRYEEFRPFYRTPLYTVRPVRGPVFLQNYQNPSFGSAMTIKRETIISYVGDKEEKKNGTTYTYSIGKNE